jgi:hypothetical protein
MILGNPRWHIDLRYNLIRLRKTSYQSLPNDENSEAVHTNRSRRVSERDRRDNFDVGAKCVGAVVQYHLGCTKTTVGQTDRLHPKKMHLRAGIVSKNKDAEPGSWRNDKGAYGKPTPQPQGRGIAATNNGMPQGGCDAENGRNGRNLVVGSQ